MLPKLLPSRNMSPLSSFTSTKPSPNRGTISPISVRTPIYSKSARSNLNTLKFRNTTPNPRPFVRKKIDFYGKVLNRTQVKPDPITPELAGKIIQRYLIPLFNPNSILTPKNSLKAAILEPVEGTVFGEV